MMNMYKRFLVLTLAVTLAALAVYADPATLLLLYTNDLHDYVKPGANNSGGLPYIAGYVASLRAQRGDILLLDGGDVMEKGDMVAFKTQSRVTYKAMNKIGYDAGAVGNHDLVHGVEHLRECADLADMALLCLNYFDSAGNLAFAPSKIAKVNGIKVGLIGMTNIRGPFEEDAARLAAEAKRLNQETDLLIVVAHIGSAECARLSAAAPEVDVFVSGHTHEALQEPRVVPETGALIVQAGQYAEYVGQLELVVDRAQKQVIRAENKLVPMCHDTIAPDTEMLAWIQAHEKEHCPEAAEVVGRASRFISSVDMGRLAAAALQYKAATEIGFCHAEHVVRSGLFAGDVDVNMLFRTGGQRGRDLLLFEMTGRQIEAYISGLMDERRGRTEWVGFRAVVTYDGDNQAWTITSDLEPDRRYGVIMPHREWENRFQRVIRNNPAFEAFDANSAKDASFTFTQAMTAYVRDALQNGESIDEHIEALMERRTLQVADEKKG